METEYIWEPVMQLLPSLLFGISASLDALLVGIGYGLRKVRIRALQNLCISLVSLLGTCLSACLGSRLLPFLPSSLACCTGSIILMLLGAYYITKWIFSGLMSHRTQPMDSKSGNNASDKTSSDKVFSDKASLGKASTDKIPIDQMPVDSMSLVKASMEKIPGRLSAWETLILSLTLSLNNIGIGLSASMAGLSLLPAAAMTFGCSALFLLCGNRLGQSRFLRLIGNVADPISGLLLIGLGIMQLTF